MPAQPRYRPPTKIPLRVILIVPFVAQILLVVGLVGYLSFRNGQQAVNNVAHQLRHEITARIEEHLNTFLTTPHRINQSNANAIEQGLLDVNDPTAMERYFWEQIKIYDSVTSIYFGNTQGGLVNAGREGVDGSLYTIVTDDFTSGPFRKYATDDQGNRAKLLQTVPDFDARTRPWYTGAVQKDDATWSDAYILFTGHDMAVAASRPVHDEHDQLLGVVSIDIFVSHIRGFLQSLQIGETGHAFIMERSGLLLASSTEENPFTDPQGDEAQRRLYAWESTVPSIQGAAAFLSQHYGDYQNIPPEQQLEFELDGQRQFLQVAPIQDPYGIDWLVVVTIPESDFMDQINANNRTTGILIGLATIITVLVSIVTTNRVSKPIRQLNRSAQALGRGEWNTIVNVDWIGELAELTSSFNSMAVQLKQTLEDLTTEITQRKHAQQELELEREFTEAALNAQRDTLFVFDPSNGQAIRWNAAFRELSGYSDEEIATKIAPHDWYSPADSEKAIQSLTETLQTGHGIIELNLITKSGKTIPTEYATSVIRDGEGNPKYLIAIGRDVSERKQAEAAIHQSHRNLTALIENTDDYVLLSDQNGMPILFNSAYARIMKEALGVEMRPGLQPHKLLPDQEVVAWWDDLHRRVLSGERFRVEYSHQFGPDDLRHLEISYHPIIEAGQVIGFSEFTRDITERKQAEQALQESNQRLEEALTLVQSMQEQMVQQERLAAVGQMAAGIAHDFNNIMATIVLYAQMTARTEELPAKVRERMATINQQAKHASKLIEQILDFSRRAVLRREPIDLLALLNEQIELLGRTLPENITLKLTTPADPESTPFTIDADPTRIRQIIANLAVNARDAMPAGGELRITLSKLQLAAGQIPPLPEMGPGHWIKLTVADTGKGIPPEVLPHVFEPFFTTKAPQGSGLGLSQVHGIVAQHSGHIDIQTRIQAGTTFTIYFPALNVSERSTPVQKDDLPQLPMGQAQLILVVEDELPVRQALMESLETLNYRVVGAENGEQALQLVDELGNELALLISDLIMPGMGGMDLFHTLQRKGAKTPMILLSGHPMDRQLKGLQSQGAIDWLLKPSSLDLLAQTVAKALSSD